MNSVEEIKERLRRHVTALSATAPRNHAHWKNLEKAAEYVEAHFKKTDGRIIDQGYEVQGKIVRNIRLILGAKEAPRFVIGAHYDAFGPYPGADDNASGVAVLLELARSLDGKKLPAPIEFVAYALEEPPHFGTDQMESVVHARSLKQDGVDVILMLCLEMVGYYSSFEGSQTFPDLTLSRQYPTQGNFVLVVGPVKWASSTDKLTEAMRAGTTLSIFSLHASGSEPGVDLSDHRSYWQEGYRAVMITDTAFYRNPHYHTELDTPDILNYREMARLTAGICHALTQPDAVRQLRHH